MCSCLRAISTFGRSTCAGLFRASVRCAKRVALWLSSVWPAAIPEFARPARHLQSLWGCRAYCTRVGPEANASAFLGCCALRLPKAIGGAPFRQHARNEQLHFDASESHDWVRGFVRTSAARAGSQRCDPQRHPGSHVLSHRLREAQQLASVQQGPPCAHLLISALRGERVAAPARLKKRISRRRFG